MSGELVASSRKTIAAAGGEPATAQAPPVIVVLVSVAPRTSVRPVAAGPKSESHRQNRGNCRILLPLARASTKLQWHWANRFAPDAMAMILPLGAA